MSQKRPDLYQQEAERLVKLPARDRKAEIAVHRRIADDTRLSETTRDHARTVAAEAYADLVPSMVAMRAEGLTLAGIAEKLTAEGHTTRRGKPWNAVQFARVLERSEVSGRGKR
ncbi:MAG: recombinase family protein [Gemmataceae bacterium]